MKKLRVAFCAIALMFIAMPGLANAVEYGGIGGRPANPRPDNPRTQSIFVLTLKPGQSTTDAVKVINNNPKPAAVSVYPVDSILSSGGAFSCAQKSDPKKDVGAWITMSSDIVNVPAHGTINVPFTVTVPSTADVGEHDGCIAIQDNSQTETVNGQNGVILGFRSAIRVAITVPGKIIKDLQIVSVKTSKLPDGNYAVTPSVRNSGNVSLDTKVKASLRSRLFNRQIVSESGVYPVLPHSTSSWNFEVKRPFWGGIFRATAFVSYYDSTAASLGHSVGPQKTVTASSGYFFVPPRPLATAVEIAILALLIATLVWFILAQRRRRLIRNHWRTYTIKEGATLLSIAESRGIAWKKIARANKLQPPYHLKPGQKLKLPPSTSKD